MGLSLNSKAKGQKKARYILNHIQLERLDIIRSEFSSESVTTTTDYKSGKLFVLSAWNEDSGMMDIDEYCEHYGLPREDISSYKLVSHTGTPYFNIAFRDRVMDEEIKEIDFDAIICKYVKPVEFIYKGGTNTGLFDRFVYTDVHVAMTTNKNGFSLYGGKWDELEIEDRRKRMVNHILANKNSDTLILDELGDFMDGWDGQTVRKGHELPQNMDNEKAFDVGLGFKVMLIDDLAPYYKKIICHNICNDNHAGAFGYVVNKAFKEIISVKYPKVVEVWNIRKFIHHYFVGKYCFILTHGKDGKNLKFGFKPVLDSKQIEKIKDYMDDNGIDPLKYVIEFSKGDSHQYIFDNSTSDSFNYYNYPAASPSSEWVQTNFKKGLSGAVFFAYRSNGTRSIEELLFKWKHTSKIKVVDYGND